MVNRYISLPKKRIVVKGRHTSFGVTFPLHLNSLPQSLFDKLCGYIVSATNQRLKKEGKVVKSVRISNVEFNIITIEKN